MLIPEEFESSADRLERLMAALPGSATEGAPAAITLEWMQQAREVLDGTATLLADPSLEKLKSMRQIQRYRSELARLKEVVERGQQQLLSQRSAIEKERARLKKVRALTGTLGSLQ
jgi:hypothetical protein